MDLNKLVLGSAGLGVAAIGAIYLVAPQMLLDVYGIHLQSASEANILRGAYGGLFSAFALLFCLGAVSQEYTRTAQIALLAFMGGSAVGRLVSIVVDGQPHMLLVAVFVVELVYACAAALLLKVGAAETYETSPAGRSSSIRTAGSKR